MHLSLFSLHGGFGRAGQPIPTGGEGDLLNLMWLWWFVIRGPGWSPPPMGFYIGILIKTSPPKGGVHKLMILQRDLPKEFLRKFFGEEMGGGQGDPDPLSCFPIWLLYVCYMFVCFPIFPMCFFYVLRLFYENGRGHQQISRKLTTFEAPPVNWTPQNNTCARSFLLKCCTRLHKAYTGAL